jgi:arginine exporter protein ArgO
MRLPEREGDWQLLISIAMLLGSIFLVILAEARHRQALQTYEQIKSIEKQIKSIEKTIREVCQ